MGGIIIPIKDLTGKKFGHLTVLRLSEKRNPINNKILWECKCDCGSSEIVYASSGNLKQGYKTSCGCAKIEQLKEVQRNNIKDLTGKKFGNLTVLYMVDGISPTTWHCVCDCGQEVNRLATSLYQGNTTNCGCGRKNLRKSLIGQKFGKLTVVKRADNYVSPSGNVQIMYECLCECGNTTIVHSTSLKKKLVNSCGCIKSVGEMLVEKYLNSIGIKFEREYCFKDCKDKRELPFDFAIFNKQYELQFLIEINGKQHYEPIAAIKNQDDAMSVLNYTQYHDHIKQTFCGNNNIPLLVIPYYNLNKHQEILNKELLKYNEL